MANGEAFSFTGTLIEGPDIDLAELSGLELSDEEFERLWGITNPRDLLLECLSCEEVLLDEVDDAPGLSDSYFMYQCDSKSDLAEELRERIRAHLGR